MLALLLVGCIDEIDPRWQLDHDHIIAARATPPRIHPGDATNLDALVAHANAPVSIENPMTAEVVSAPSTLYADGPTPVEVLLTFPHPSGLDRAALDPYRVKKTVWLGEPRPNPDLPPVVIDGQPAPAEDATIALPLERDVYISIDAPEGSRVNWLTNVGTLFQDDVATAYVRVTAKDRLDGQLVVVLRDSEGGVVWGVWSVRAQTR
ncbi:MAG TPA: hypothetical protein VL326_09315 [Kofleriaceae bacterium]|nr:hypothetical protein [Kofleriaceae bacterium]